jgi:hypothetical protein
MHSRQRNAGGAVRCVCSRLYGKGNWRVNPNARYDPELLKLMNDALDAALRDKHSGDDIAGRATRTAMAFQIITTVGAGERNPERLKLAAVDTTCMQRGRTPSSALAGDSPRRTQQGETASTSAMGQKRTCLLMAPHVRSTTKS